MYSVDEKDCVIEVRDFPQPSVGAPMPCVLANERQTVLAYPVQEKTPICEMSREELAAVKDFREEMALVRFGLCIAHMWGPPNDEAFEGHPLAKRGLSVYGIFRIDNSSWIRQLERMNSVHRSHNPEVFWKKRHYIFCFHDSIFECVCDGFDLQVTRGNSIVDVVSEMVELLH